MVVFDPYDWQLHEDPYPVYRQLRDEAPAYYNEQRGFWALSRYADVLAAFRDVERFSNEKGVQLEPQVQDAKLVMSFLGMDPPRHTRLRSLVNRGFSPRRISRLEPRIQGLATTYIDGFIERGSCDFIEEFAGRLPMDVVSEMLGVPPEDRDELRRWADLVLHREEGNPEVPPAGMKAAANLLGYFARHVEDRRARPRGDDLTEALIASEIDGERLADADIIPFLFLMIIAGNETTTKLLGNAMFWLWKNPEQRQRVREDPGLIPAWAEETLRYDASSQLIGRTSTCDVEIHGRKIPGDSRVALLIGSANRDERFWEEPDVFDVGRNTQALLSFGNGTHFCLGASLARLEARVSLEEIQRRLPDYEVDATSLVRVHSSNVRGFASVPIRFPGRALLSEARTAYVTGASSGFGAAIARALGERGWPVALGARRVDRLEEVSREVESAGGKAFAHPLDVSDAASIEAFFAAAEQTLGPAQVFVSNAGTALPGLLHEVPAESLRTEIETNLLGAMLATRRALPAMLEARAGDVVFVTSLNATVPRPLQAGYTASKAGLEAAARVLQMELEGTGVRSTIVRPGPSKTELGWDWDPGLIRSILKSWKEWGVLRHQNFLAPEAIAAAVMMAVTAPRGTHLDLIQVNPEAPTES